jgi:hypothetical protein
MLYRHENWIETLGIQRFVSLNLPEESTTHQSFVDAECLYSLIRFAEGPITSVADINSVEHAIRSLVFHDSPQILAPALNIRYIADPIWLFKYGLHPNDPDLVRHDFPGHSSSALHDLLAHSKVHGQIIPIDELVQFSSFDVMQSFIQEKQSYGPDIGNHKSGHHSVFRYICLDAHEYFEHRMWLQNIPLNTFARSIGKYGRPTYVHSPVISDALDIPLEVNASAYFDRIQKNWNAHLGQYAKYRTNIKLPICLSIILNRAKSREDIFNSISQMRDEFSIARRTLWLDVDDALMRSASEADCIRILSKIERSADAIIPAGLRTGEFYSPINFRWLGRLMQWIVSGVGVTEVLQFADSALGGGHSSLHSVDSSELLARSIGDLQPYHHLIKRHLSPSEIALLSRDME